MKKNHPTEVWARLMFRNGDYFEYRLKFPVKDAHFRVGEHLFEYRFCLLDCEEEEIRLLVFFEIPGEARSV